jgi:membrane associated rhomboid family serine protease
MTVVDLPTAMSCPTCHGPLLAQDVPARDGGPTAIAWRCPTCAGMAVGVAVLRRVVRPDFLDGLWRSGDRAAFGTRPCPGCRQTMRAITPLGGIGTIGLCRRCQLAWFQEGGLARCPQRELPTAAAALPAEVRRELAMAEVKELARRKHDGSTHDPPDAWWKMLVGMLGLPVEAETPALSRRPLATWTVTALMVVVTLLTLQHVNGAIAAGGFVPADPLRHGGLTLVSAFFLHAGLIHLLGNAYFLMMVGDNVEDVIGWRRFLLLLAASDLGGNLLHALFDPHSQVPCVGASGGISGVMAFYACAFPRARLCLLMRWWWWRIPAWGAFAGWVVLQAIGAWEQVMGLSHVSSLAHLGGAAVGIGWWLWWRRQQAHGVEPVSGSTKAA